MFSSQPRRACERPLEAYTFGKFILVCLAMSIELLIKKTYEGEFSWSFNAIRIVHHLVTGFRDILLDWPGFNVIENSTYVDIICPKAEFYPQHCC